MVGWAVIVGAKPSLAQPHTQGWRHAVVVGERRRREAPGFLPGVGSEDREPSGPVAAARQGEEGLFGDVDFAQVPPSFSAFARARRRGLDRPGCPRASAWSR